MSTCSFDGCSRPRADVSLTSGPRVFDPDDDSPVIGPIPFHSRALPGATCQLCPRDAEVPAAWRVAVQHRDDGRRGLVSACRHHARRQANGFWDAWQPFEARRR